MTASKKERKSDRALSSYGSHVKCVHDSGGGKSENRDDMGDNGVDGMIILKWS
jgi:hypothetical protein